MTLQAGNRTFPAHKYILSMRSEFFRKQFMSERGLDEELDGEVRKSEDAVGCDLIILEKIPPDMLEYALHFIYTDSCELLVHGARPRVSGASTGPNQVRRRKTKCHSPKLAGFKFILLLEYVQNICMVLEELSR